MSKDYFEYLKHILQECHYINSVVTEKPDKNDKLKLTNYLTKQNLLGEYKFKKVIGVAEIPFTTIRNSFGLGSKTENAEDTNSEL